LLDPPTAKAVRRAGGESNKNPPKVKHLGGQVNPRRGLVVRQLADKLTAAAEEPIKLSINEENPLGFSGINSANQKMAVSIDLMSWLVGFIIL